MNQTLKWKKTIGILAIVISGMRIIDLLYLVPIMPYFEQIISTLRHQTDGDLAQIISSLTGTLRTLYEMGMIYLPVILILLAAVLIVSILLLCADKGTADSAPREKARTINTILLFLLIAYALVEATFLLLIPSSLTGPLIIPMLIDSLAFAVVIIVFSSLGFSRIAPELPAAQTKRTRPHRKPKTRL